MVLLFGLETWLLTPFMGRALGGFQYQVAQQLKWRLPRWKNDRKWNYTSEVAAREVAGLQTIGEYIRRWQNTVTKYIATLSLIDLCEGLERALGERVGIRWWEQEGINMTGER